ncbi:MAG: TetR family transcriptional regulator [Rhizobiaceae bacterium]|jgi:AcrR family transcriptional regulator
MALSVRDHTPDSSRADILEAAAHCFMARGYAATSIDDVARRLGATKGRIYHHYSSKSDLFADVFRSGMEMNYQAILPFRSGGERAMERWRKMAFVHVVQMIATQQFQRVVWEGVEMHLRGATTPEQRSVFAELIESRSRYSEIFRDLLAKARDDGDMAFENLGIANQLVFMTLNSPIFWYSPRAGETMRDIEDIAKQIVAFAMHGLGAREGNP